MPWKKPTSDDVLSEFTPSEQTSIGTLVDDDTLDLIVFRTVDEIRGFIIAGGYSLDPDPKSIPQGLFNDCISIARWRLLISAPSFKQLQTEERHQLYVDALAKLNKIADQKFSPEPPVEDELPPPGASNWNSEIKFPMRTHPIPRSPSIAGAYANPDGPPDFPQ
jgi:hypothetical protein